MIQVTKTPLRISLAGGSTDLQEYLNRYGEGKVISFTPDLFTYIIMKVSTDNQYKIVYSKIEKVKTLSEIKNDVAREVLSYFKMPPVEVIFTADIPSSGSGLASSTSYLINLIKACLQFQNKEMSILEIGKLAIELERKFNPLTGYQDVYGCLIEGFKIMTFNKYGLQSSSQLPTSLQDYYDFYLVPTNSIRSSTTILETIEYDKVHSMATLATNMLSAINEDDYARVACLINIGWTQKKLTSPSIVNNEIADIEFKFEKVPTIVAWRLIGAGNGGYFLVVTEKDSYLPIKNLKIKLYND